MKKDSHIMRILVIWLINVDIRLFRTFIHIRKATTLTARILKLSSDSQSRIEPTPLYSRRKPADCRADSAVAPVAHEISPDHRF